MEQITETQQYVAFRLGQEVFALEVSHVREILQLTRITRVPGMPGYILGLIDVRDKAIPVLDMRRKFGIKEAAKKAGKSFTVDTCVIVVEVAVDQERSVIGALADGVEEVAEFDLALIQPPPSIGLHLKTDYIKGLGKKDDRFIMLLDIDKVFSAEELAAGQATREIRETEEMQEAANQ